MTKLIMFLYIYFFLFFSFIEPSFAFSSTNKKLNRMDETSFRNSFHAAILDFLKYVLADFMGVVLYMENIVLAKIVTAVVPFSLNSYFQDRSQATVQEISSNERPFQWKQVQKLFRSTQLQ